MERAKALNQLDAVLRCLLEKSHMDRNVWMKMLGKHPWIHTTRIVPLLLLAKGHLPASSTSGGRGRRWTMGWLRGVLRDPTHVIKLFDRSVDLAQFSENTPLYPICCAWMRNNPSVRERERSPSSPLPPLPEDEEGSEVINCKSCDVYKLPPPTSPGSLGDTCRSQIPSPLQPETQGTPDDKPSEPEPSLSTLIYRNMQRWKRIGGISLE